MTPARWIYDSAAGRLILDNDGDQHEVSLSPQQHRLIAYMAQRNAADGGAAVLCQREEMISAIWADEPNHGPQDLAYVVHQLRARVEGRDDTPELIVNERGRGYRLLASSGVADSPGLVDRPVSENRRRLLLAGVALVAVLGAGAVAMSGSSNRSPETILREGSRGQDVIALQRELQELGYDPVYVDGQYGPLTASAVRAFQQDSGLVVDGEVGPETRRVMRQALERRGSPAANP